MHIFISLVFWCANMSENASKNPLETKMPQSKKHYLQCILYFPTEFQLTSGHSIFLQKNAGKKLNIVVFKNTICDILVATSRSIVLKL